MASQVRGISMRGSIRRFFFLLAAVLACSVLLVTGQQPSAAGPFTAEQANAGRAAFQTNCAGCHGADLMGYPPLAGPAFIGNTWSAATPERLRTSEAAVHTFFDELRARARWPSERVVFVVDGFRVYDEGSRPFTEESYFGRMRRFFMREAAARGYGVIDMEPIFSDRHARDGSRFDFDDDRHWNGLAHGLAADAVVHSRAFRIFVEAR